MTLSPKLMAMFACGILLAGLAMQWLPGTAAQDTTKPVITDLTAGTPVVGGNFTIRALVTDDDSVSTVHLYPYFILPSPNDPIVLPGILMEPKPNDVYEAELEIPINALELRYSFIAKDLSLNSKSTDVAALSILDDIPPTAVCESVISLNMGATHMFNGSSSTDNVGIANYTWSFQYGGGTVSLYGPNASFDFLVSGQYSGSLTVKDFSGNTNSRSFQVVVGDSQPPVANAGPPMVATAGRVTVFDGSGSSDNMGIANYTWVFTHNGTLVKLYGAKPAFIFWTPGAYDVTLTVKDATGNANSVLLSVQVNEQSAQPGEGGGFLPWWGYALIIMVCLFMVMAIMILKMD